MPHCDLSASSKKYSLMDTGRLFHQASLQYCHQLTSALATLYRKQRFSGTPARPMLTVRQVQSQEQDESQHLLTGGDSMKHLDTKAHSASIGMASKHTTIQCSSIFVSRSISCASIAHICCSQSDYLTTGREGTCVNRRKMGTALWGSPDRATMSTTKPDQSLPTQRGGHKHCFATIS